MAGSESDKGGDSEPTRVRIMDIAEAHLVRMGYRAVSLQQVARDVGVTKPSLYYHFPQGKEELVVAILRRSLARVRAGLAGAMQSADDGASKLRAAARWIHAEPARGHRMGALHDALRFLDESHHEALTGEFHTAVYEPIRSAIAEAITSGEFRSGDAEFLAWSFLSLATGMFDSGRTAQRSPDDPAERMVDLFLHGVRA